MEIYGPAVASQGFESPYLQTSPRRLKLREATSGKPNSAKPLMVNVLRWRSLSDEASWSFRRQGVVGLLVADVGEPPPRLGSERLRLAGQTSLLR
jgi:hypothetical protein